MPGSRFRVYFRSQKCIYNDFELQRMLKKNPKTLKRLEYEDLPPDDIFVNAAISEPPRLSSLARLLKKNKSLSCFKLRTYSYRFYNIHQFFSALKNLQSLSTFHMEFSEQESFTPRISRSFTLCTKNLKSLTNLNCKFYGSVINPTKSLKALKFMTPLNLLSELSLNLNFSSWLTDKSWSTFSYNLPFLTSLSSLSIFLNHSKAFTQKGLGYLFSSLGKLPLLTAFHLEAMGSEIVDFPTLTSLFENLKDLVHFQDLTLSLTGCRNLKSEHQNPLALALGLLNPSSFRKLSLDFYANFSDDDFFQFLLVIQKFPLLAYLALKFDQFAQVTPKCFNNLPATLSQLTCLTHINFAVSPRMGLAYFFKIFSPCLKDLKRLISIDLNGWTVMKIQNEAVVNFCSQLSHLSQLEYLNLSLNLNSGDGEKFIAGLSEALLKLTALKGFQLHFYGDPEMDAKIFERFISSFQNLKCLRELKLFLWNCIGLTQGVLQALTKSLEFLTCLDKLEFDFKQNWALKKNDVENYENLIRFLDSLESLTEIRLRLPRSQEYSDELLQKVLNGTKYFCIYWV